MKNVLVVCNYNAGRKTAIKNKKQIIKFLIKRCENFKIISISELNEIDFNFYDTLIAVGGDGTINKLLPYLVYKNKTLGIIPCGSANLLAAKLGIPCNIKKALQIIEEGNRSKIDTISVQDKMCVLRFGLGFDANIICNTPQKIKNQFGYLSYFIAGIIFCFRLKLKKYTINYENMNKEIKASCIIVANSPNMYKNTFSVGNNSKLDDGKFEIFILKTENPIIFMFKFLKIILNIKKTGKYTEYINTNNFEINNEISTCHIDGEKIKIKDDIFFEIKNKSLNVFIKK